MLAGVSLYSDFGGVFMDNKALLEHLDWGISLEREIYTLEQVYDSNEKQRMTMREEPQAPPETAYPAPPTLLPIPDTPKTERTVSFRHFIKERKTLLLMLLAALAVILVIVLVLQSGLNNMSSLDAIRTNSSDIEARKTLISVFISLFEIGLLASFLWLYFGFKRAKRKQHPDSLRAKDSHAAAVVYARGENQQREARYKEQCDKILQDHENSLQEVRDFNSNAALFNAALNEVQTVIVGEKQGLEEQLAEVYGLGVIHQKYHNIIAYASFYDYLDTKRCYILEGPDGAYDTFEEELRMDAVVSRLDRAVNDLEKIKESQHTLYMVMQEANRSISQLGESIRAGLGNLMQGQRGLAKELSAERADSRRIISQIKGLDAGIGKLAAMNRDVKNYLAQMGRAGK
jgi:hypothetical protein